jgi:hypothetical protein
MKKAWVENGKIRDIANGDPDLNYHPDIAALYTTDVPDTTVGGATLVDGVWTNPPPPLPPTEAEIAAYQVNKDEQQAVNVRATRNQKLADSDWTQLADAPVDKATWETYRQALRDITAQSGFPWTMTWPVQP